VRISIDALVTSKRSSAIASARSQRRPPMPFGNCYVADSRSECRIDGVRRSFGLALGVALALAGSAGACPPGRPCLKQKNRPPAVREEVPDRYLRSVKGAPPAFERKRVAKFLLAGTWKPIYDKPLGKTPSVAGATQIIRETDALRFVDPTKPMSEAKPGERIVLVRYVERNKGRTLVDVDGEIFWLQPCKTRKDYACLVVSEIGFAEVDPDHPPQPALGPVPE
jgi:hypothetical protein